jgi:hypothetical protein
LFLNIHNRKYGMISLISEDGPRKGRKEKKKRERDKEKKK